MSDIIRIDQDVIRAEADLDQSPALIYLASLAESGRRTMLGKLTRVAEMIGHKEITTVPWHQLRYQHLVAIRTRLQELEYAPATVNSIIYAIRGVMRSCFNLKLIDADELERIRAVRPVRGERLPAGRAISPGELAALMLACEADPGPAGVRDAAAIALMYAAGLRRSEVVSLDVSSHDPKSGGIQIVGKGDRERRVFIDNGAADAVADWDLVLNQKSGPLFVPIDKGSKVHRGRRMSGQAVYDLLKKRARQGGVRDVRCHDLRRSFVSDLLDAGADISVASQLAGHSQVNTTARYDRRGDDAKRRAVALLHIPYRRRQQLPLDGE